MADPVISSRLSDKKVKKLHAQLIGFLWPDEEVAALFPALSMSYTILVFTDLRAFGVDPTQGSRHAKACKRVVRADEIVSYELETTSMKGLKLRFTRRDETVEEFGNLRVDERQMIEEQAKRLASSELPESARLALDSARERETAHASALANVPYHGSRVNAPTRKEIERHCRPGESPLFVIGAGIGQGALAAFPDRLVIVKKGIMTGAMAGTFLGGRVSTFNYRDITGVEYNAGLLTGVLEILTPSYQGSANKDFWRGTFKSRNADSNDPYTLSNTLPMDKTTFEQVRVHVNELNRLVAEAKKVEPASDSPPTGGLADELSKLAELHRSGVLDEDEFKAAKRALLSSGAPETG